MDKLVSVIIPVYNREKTIIKAIESVIRQSYTNWELIVVDDGSTDDTFRIVSEKANEVENIRIISNIFTKGPSGARNSGIRAAKGAYISFLDSDDEWFECHLEECMEAIEKTGYEFCSALWIESKFGIYNKIGEEGWYNYIFNDMKKNIGINRDDFYWKFDEKLFRYIVLTDFYCFHINTLVIKKDLLIKTGGFNEKMKQSEDLDLIYRLLQETNLVTVNNYHFLYQYGPDNLYAFVDYNNLKIDEVLKNREVVDKISRHIKYKLILLKNTKKYIMKNDKQAMDAINYSIYERQRSYAYVCKDIHKLRSIFLIVNSLKYYFKYSKKEDKFFKPYSEFRKNNLYIA